MIDYWRDIVNEKKNIYNSEKNLEKIIIETNFLTKYFKIKSFLRSWIKSKRKIVVFYYQKIISKFN